MYIITQQNCFFSACKSQIMDVKTYKDHWDAKHSKLPTPEEIKNMWDILVSKIGVFMVFLWFIGIRSQNAFYIKWTQKLESIFVKNYFISVIRKLE